MQHTRVQFLVHTLHLFLVLHARAPARAESNKQATSENAMAYIIELSEDILRWMFKGTWCSGITPAQHAAGPGLNPQHVHFARIGKTRKVK